MPRVEYTSAKGLVQSTGAGFALNQIENISGNTTLTQGTTVAIGKSGGTHEITLPPKEGAHQGDVVIIIMDHTAGKLKATDTQLGGDVTFNAVGDGAVCVFDGTEWQVIVSNG
jgi:hypothetical protein